MLNRMHRLQLLEKKKDLKDKPKQNVINIIKIFLTKLIQWHKKNSQDVTNIDQLLASQKNYLLVKF